MLILAIPILAQQQSPATPPADQPAPPPKQTDEKQNKTSGTNQDKKVVLGTAGSDDRIFMVMPNYLTVENADRLPPLRPGEKFKVATDDVFDYFTYPFVGFLAAISQAENSPKSWGQGWGAYGKRFGEQFADNGFGTYMTSAVFPSILRQDPRYYQLGKGSFRHRAAYSATRLFVSRSDSQHAQFNYSEIAGNAAMAGLSNIYHPPEDRNVSRTLSTWGTLIMWDGVSNEFKEFWPDIRRKVFHRTAP
ncbi:MAG: hypothetical protein ACRD4S_00675 [Candidatus Acidiferrales bacterium]